MFTLYKRKTKYHNLPASCTVFCGKEQHMILVNNRGRIFLQHHRVLKIERIVAALGGDMCRCLEIFEAWRLGRYGKPGTIPSQLSIAFSCRMSKSTLRKKVKPSEGRHYSRFWRLALKEKLMAKEREERKAAATG